MRWVEHPPGTYLGRVVADAGAAVPYRDGVRELLGRPPRGPGLRSAGPLPPAVLRYLQPSLRPGPWAAGHTAPDGAGDRSTARDDPPPGTADHHAGIPGRALGGDRQAAPGPTTPAPDRRAAGPAEPPPTPPRIVAGPQPSPSGGAGDDRDPPAHGRESVRPAFHDPAWDRPASHDRDRPASSSRPASERWAAAAPSPSRLRSRPHSDVPAAPLGSGGVPDTGLPPSAPAHLPAGGPAPGRTRPSAQAGSDPRLGAGAPSSVPPATTPATAPAPSSPPTSEPHRDAAHPARAQLRRSADAARVAEGEVVAGRTGVAPRSPSRQLRPRLTEASRSTSGAVAAGQLRSRPGSAVDAVRSAVRAAAAPPVPPAPPRPEQPRTPPTPPGRTAAGAPDAPRRRERVVRAPGGPVVSAYWSRLNVGRVGLRGPR